MDSKTDRIIDIFKEINTVPRKSKDEEKISNWLVDWAKKNGLQAKQDAVKNVYIYAPATKGREKDPTVILQAHMDMVCEKTPDSKHDFTKDPIKHIVEGDWMHADNTTLGADNGIGIAMALAAATDASLSRPPIEILITVDEETGLNGAKNIQKEYIKGKILLNMDSEDEGVFTIGCAGGRDTAIQLKLTKEKDTPELLYKIAVDGLKGGHSGVDIHEFRENANILLARTLGYVLNGVKNVRLADMGGGSAHNAIPRNAYAVVAVGSSDGSKVKDIVATAAQKLEVLSKTYDPNVKISVTEVKEKRPVYSAADTMKAVTMMSALPHGVAKMSVDMPGLVETSNNFATIKLENDTLCILLSQRSSINTQLDWIVSKVEAVAALAGASYKTGDGYPGWKPDVSSKILALCKKVYTDMNGKEPKIEAIHAGLECGLIGANFSDMDMISFGPTIKSPHSPQERVFLPSIIKSWDFFKELLKAIK